MAPPVPTQRLAFRELQPSDLDFVAAMLGHPEVMRFYPKLLSREEALAWIDRQVARYEIHGHGLWLVSERDTGQPVGQVGLCIQPVDASHEPEIGYLLHFPFWHHGYATEAALGVRDHSFHTIGYSHAISLIRPVNAPSQAVARRIGMHPLKRTEFAGTEHLVFRVNKAEAPRESTSVA